VGVAMHSASFELGCGETAPSVRMIRRVVEGMFPDSVLVESAHGGKVLAAASAEVHRS
jgi:hypothetical protein